MWAIFEDLKIQTAVLHQDKLSNFYFSEPRFSCEIYFPHISEERDIVTFSRVYLHVLVSIN